MRPVRDCALARSLLGTFFPSRTGMLPNLAQRPSCGNLPQRYNLVALALRPGKNTPTFPAPGGDPDLQPEHKA